MSAILFPLAPGTGGGALAVMNSIAAAVLASVEPVAASSPDFAAASADQREAIAALLAADAAYKRLAGAPDDPAARAAFLPASEALKNATLAITALAFSLIAAAGKEAATRDAAVGELLEGRAWCSGGAIIQAPAGAA